MAAFNFPNSPSTNDTHSENNVTWKWDGTMWNRVSDVGTTLTHLNVTGISTLGGNVQIGGVLTYEDVKNVDSVGIITARDGLKVLAGGANVVGVVTATTFKGNGDFVELDVDGHTNLDNVSIAGVSTFTENVSIVKTAGPLLELTTNTGAADATLRLSEGATGSTTNGGGMVYSGADNKLHITCGANSTTKRITINRDDGKIGIGSEIPNSKLEVHNGANIEVLRLKDTHFNKYLTIRGGGSPNRMVIDSYEGGGGGADIDFASNGSTKVRITSTGLLSIGDASNLDSQLTITQAQGDCIRLRTSATNNTFKYGIIKQEPYNNNALGVQIIGGKSDSGYSEVAIGGGIDGGYAATQIDFYTGATTTTATGTKRARINLTGQLLLGPGSLATTKATLAGSLDLGSGGISLCIGGDENNTGRTNSTNKLNRVASPHYTNAEEPVAMVSSYNVSNQNILSYGGGSGLTNAATSHSFYTAANTTTTNGTVRLKINSTGHVTIGEANFTASNDIHLKKANAGGDVALRITNNTNQNSGSTASLYFTTSPTQDFNTAYIRSVRDGGKLRFGYHTNEPVVTMRVSTGMVGIGTDNPTSPLSFNAKRSTQTVPPICFQTSYGTGLADAAISTTDDSGGTDIMMGSNVYMGQNGAFLRYYSSYGSAGVRCQYTGKTLFYNKSGNNAPEESMRIDGDGRLRIGNTTQNQYTAADDLIVGSGNGDRGLTIYSGSSDAGVIAFSDGTIDTAYRSGQIIYDHSADAMDFRTNGNYIRMKIDTNGDIHINGPAEASGRVTIKGTNSNGSTCYAVTNSGKAKEGIDVTCTTVGDGNFGGAISFGCGGNGRSAIAAVQTGGDDDVNGLAFFTHGSNNGADNANRRMTITHDGVICGQPVINREFGTGNGYFTTNGAWKVLVDLSGWPDSCLYICDAAMQHSAAYTATFWVYKTQNDQYKVIHDQDSLLHWRINGSQLEVQQNSGIDQTNTFGYQKIFMAFGMALAYE